MKVNLSDKEWFKKCVEESDSAIEAIIKLGYDTPSNYYKIFNKYCKKYNIDKSHFTSRSNRMLGKQIHKKYELKDILIEDFQGIYSGTNLKNKLYQAGLKTKICELCGQDENWITGKISLILDHINGNNKDNRIENLRIICPNCDTTLPTYKGRNKNKINNSNFLNQKKEEFKNKQKIIEEFKIIINNLEKDYNWKNKFCSVYKWSRTKLNNFIKTHNL